MDKTINFSAAKDKKAIWFTSNKFNIDDNLGISLGIFRSTRKEKRSTNHIWYIELAYRHNNELLQQRFNANDLELLDKKIIDFFNNLKIKPFKQPLYLFAINSIILKVVHAKFSDNK